MTSESSSTPERLEDARLLDRGGEAEIYEWGDGRVLRLLNAGTRASLDAIRPEVAAMRAAGAAGVPVPGVYDLVEFDGRVGYVMDRIDGGPMLDALLRQPWKMLGLIREFGAIHARVHGIRAPEGMTSSHERLTRELARLPDSDAELRGRGEQLLATLPGGESLLHGDYHPLNLLLDRDRPVVIDWPAATSGPPEADVARTSVLMAAATPPKGMPVMLWLMGALRRRLFIPRYVAAYRKQRSLDLDQVRQWKIVHAIARLVEAPPEEGGALRELISDDR